MRLLLILAFLILGTAPFGVYGQFTGDIVGSGLSVGLSPQYPGPGDRVTATLNDYALDANGASISWFINQQSVPDSENQRSVSLVAGEVGSVTNIEARITFPNGQNMSAKGSISPLYVDVIVEPQTYSPAFYQGRSLPIFGSTVYLTALVSTAGGVVDSSNYSYGWQLNNKTLSGGSTRGNNKTKIIIPYGRNSVVGISIYDTSGKMIARRLIQIPSVEVDLQFYEVSTLYGLSHKVIGNPFNLISNSTTIRVAPYNLDLFSITDNLFTEWQVDGQKQQSTRADPFEITVRGQRAGITNITFKIRNLSELLQGGQASFQIQS